MLMCLSSKIPTCFVDVSFLKDTNFLSLLPTALLLEVVRENVGGRQGSFF